MSTIVQRTSNSGRQSMFFHDLASPVSSRRGQFNTPGQAAAVSALWRENFATSDLPPPPVFTLEDRSDFSPSSPFCPEIGMQEYSISPVTKSDPRTPARGSTREFFFPSKSNSEVSTSFSLMSNQQYQQGPGSSSWWSPAKNGSEQDDRGVSSPVQGVVQSGALITVPPPQEVARPELERNSLPVGNLEMEEWVTVFGFLPGDTNLVLREFEKCGAILKHVPGPRDSNWMHILYQKHSDAVKAFNKNGMQINGVLVVGVKPVDPMQRDALNVKLNNQGFMTLPTLPPSRSLEPNTLRVTPQLQNGSSAFTRQSTSTIARQSKSMVSKFTDLMFGF